MLANTQLLYEFGPFQLNATDRAFLRNGEAITLQPRTYEVLLMLVRSGSQIVEKTELISKVWGVEVSEGVVSFQINQLRKTLGDDALHPKYIQTVPKRGYRFVARVTELERPRTDVEKYDSTGAEIRRQEIGPEIKTDDYQLLERRSFSPSSHGLSSRLVRPLGGHLFHALLASTSYSGLFAIAVLEEIAYDFDRYGPAAMKVALVVSCWIFVTSFAGLAADWKLTLQGSEKGLMTSVTIFLISAMVLFAGVRQFLPSFPITQASFQTYTAQAAYLKSTFYFLILTLLFLITPFHFVIAAQQELRAGRRKSILALLTSDKLSIVPKGTIYPRLWILTLLLMALAVMAVALRAHLFDNLSPSPYMNLFMHLGEIRSILYFALGMECLAWYYRSLMELKRECLS